VFGDVSLCVEREVFKAEDGKGNRVAVKLMKSDPEEEEVLRREFGAKPSEERQARLARIRTPAGTAPPRCSRR
jgi:hypothetical protein